MNPKLVSLIFALLLGGASGALAQDKKPVLFKDKSPAELYRIVHRARWGVDIDTVLACTSRRADATQESVYRQLMAGRSSLPQAINVLKAEARGKTAMLQVEGRRRDRDTDKEITSRGKVTLIKEDGTWRIRHETWADVGEAPVPGVD